MERACMSKREKHWNLVGIHPAGLLVLMSRQFYTNSKLLRQRMWVPEKHVINLISLETKMSQAVFISSQN